MKQALLLLRIPEHEDETVYWQTCRYNSDKKSDDGHKSLEVEDSGRLPTVRELHQLTTLAENRSIITLVPGAQVTIRELSVPGRLSSMVIKSLPYRLEEDLAGDVENLHISILQHHEDILHLAVVDHKLMEKWLGWLNTAGLPCHKLLPDTLALPVTEHAINLYRMGSYWLARHGQWQTAVCDNYWLEHYLASIDRDKQLSHVKHGDIQVDNNPLDILAAGAVCQNSNLLQGEFEPQGDRKSFIQTWRRAAVLGCLTFAVWLGASFYAIWHMENQADQLRKEAAGLYQELFPGERVIRLIPQLNRKLADLESAQNNASLLVHLDTLASIIDDNSIKAQLLSYSQSQNTLRVVAQADNMASFTAIRNNAASIPSVSLESLSQSGHTITGVIVVRGTQ